MIRTSDIIGWLTENGYIYNSDGLLDPQISLEETQRMVNELMEKEND